MLQFLSICTGREVRTAAKGVVLHVPSPQVPIPYNFDYSVSAGDTNFGHSEQGDGHGSAHGGYWVNLPDGRVQNVDYWADGSGYHPVVTYQGNAVYPAGNGGGYY